MEEPDFEAKGDEDGVADEEGDAVDLLMSFFGLFVFSSVTDIKGP